jgi:Cu/Ag efflux pump CusA
VAVLLFAELPLFLIGGVTGAFVQPIVAAYSFVVLASTAAALVVTPILASYLLRRARPVRPAGRPAAEPSRVRTAIAATGAGLVRRPVWAYLLVTVLVVVGGAGLLTVHSGPLVPALQDRDLLVQWQGAPGTSITEMDRITDRAGEALRATNGVRDVASHVGQALLGDQIVGSNSAETWITLAPDADYASTLSAVRHTLSAYVGVSHTLLTYPQASLDAAPAGNSKAITVRVYGTDLQTLEAKAKEVQRSVAAIQGVEVDPKVAMPTVEPAVQIQTNVSAAARYGLKPGDVRRQTAVMIAGIPVGSYYHDQQIFDVTVWSVPELRQNVTDVGKLLIATPARGQVPLDVIASVTVQPSPTEIDHDRASRYVDVTADYSGSDLDQVIARASEDVRAIQMPLGYHAEVFSDLQVQEDANLYVWLAALGAIVAIYLLLQAVFCSWSRATLLFFTLPLAVVGMLPAVMMIGAPLSLGVLVATFLVLGVATRNGVLLIRDFQERERSATHAAAGEIVLAGAREALGPVLTTAVGIALVLLPFVVQGDVAGMEILRPLGVAVMGGLVTSSLLTLVIVPALYLRFVARTPSADDQPQEGGA